MLSIFQKRFLLKKLLEGQGRTLEKRQAERGDDGLDMLLGNTSIAEVIGIVEEFIDTFDLQEIDDE